MARKKTDTASIPNTEKAVSFAALYFRRGLNDMQKLIVEGQEARASEAQSELQEHVSRLGIDVCRQIVSIMINGHRQLCEDLARTLVERDRAIAGVVDDANSIGGVD